MFAPFKNQKGFTLIELVIIIILIGVLAAIAVPRYVDLRDNAVRAAAQATLDAGRAGINLHFAGEVLNAGTYTSLLSNTGAGPGVLVAQDITNLEATLQSLPNYPPGGTYNTPAGAGFRWYLLTQGNLDPADPAQPPVVDGIIDLTCDVGDALTGANDDCFVSRL